MIWLIGFSALLFAGVFRGQEAMDYLDEKTDAWVRFDSLFKKYASKEAVRWEWLKSFCLVESDLGRAKSVALGMREPSNIEGSKSSDGKSWGVMQMTLPTAKDFDPTVTVEKLNNPEYSIGLSAKYIAWCMKQFSSADPRFLEFVVKSYNQGVGNSLNEMRGKSKGFAHDYWAKWQKQYKRVMEG